MNTQTHWQFTPDEFAWVWSAETGLDDDYPYPIVLRETPETQNERAYLRAEIGARYPPHADPDLTGPLRALANPDLRIICTGTFRNSPRRVRSLAAGSGDLGVILFQKPGPTPEFGGDLTLVVTRRANLGKHIAATMPTAPAGAAAAMRGYTPRVRGDEPPTTWASYGGDRPVEERIRTLLQAPRTAEGHLCIERYLHDRHPHSPAYLNWIDVDDRHSAAGRYIIDVNRNDTVVTPATETFVAQELYRCAELGDS